MPHTHHHSQNHKDGQYHALAGTQSAGTSDILGRSMNECNPARQELGGVFAVCYHVTNYPEHSDFKHHVLNYQTAAVDQASSRAKHGASGSRLSRAVLSRLCGGAGGGRGVEGTCLEL